MTTDTQTQVRQAVWPEGLAAATATADTLPRISVVVPCLNRAHYLRETLDSILTQDYPDIECIVVDAGSTDGTLDLLRSYGDRIRWISEPDNGAFDAINKGWKMSSGEVLAWLNADDRWEPGAARIAGEFFAAHPEVGVLYGDCGGVDPAGNLLEVYPARDWDLEGAVLVCDHIINQAAAFMRREAVEEVGWLYPAWCHDHDLWLRMGAAGAVFQPLRAHLASARIQDANLGNVPAVVIPAKVGLTRRFFELPGLPLNLRRIRRRAISNAYVRGFDYLRPTVREHWTWGWHCLREAVSADPLNTPHVILEILSRLKHAALRTETGGELYGGARVASQAGASVGRSAVRTAVALGPEIMLFLIWRELRKIARTRSA